MSEHRDPRFRTSSYRLTDLRRGEPDAAAFKLPLDYALKDYPRRHHD